MGMASEFKEFAVKGNVIDLAVGVIIGGAFGKIVDSIVGDIIMPVVSRIFGGLDFSNYFIPLAGQTATTLAEAKKAGAVLAYGSFVTVALNFVILAFIIFMMVKQINRLKKEAPAAPQRRPRHRRTWCCCAKSATHCASRRRAHGAGAGSASRGQRPISRHTSPFDSHPHRCCNGPPGPAPRGPDRNGPDSTHARKPRSTRRSATSRRPPRRPRRAPSNCSAAWPRRPPAAPSARPCGQRRPICVARWRASAAASTSRCARRSCRT